MFDLLIIILLWEEKLNVVTSDFPAPTSLIGITVTTKSFWRKG